MSGVDREILGNVRDLETLMYVVVSIAVAIGAVPFLLRVRVWLRAGAGEDRLPAAERLYAFFRLVFGQGRLSEGDWAAGLMHRLIFFGFAGLFLATVLTGIDHWGGVHFLKGRTYLVFAFGADLAGLAFVAGVVWAVVRRYVTRPARLEYKMRGDAIALFLLLAVGLTGFLLEGARLSQAAPAYESVSFIGYRIGFILGASGLSGEGIHRVVWIVHLFFVAALLAVIPATRLRHVLAAPIAILVGARSLGRIDRRPIPLPGQPGTAPGGGPFERGLTIQFDACTACGRCSAVCPAAISEKPLSPMHLLQDQRLGRPVAGEAVWSCTTCGACEQACPIGISHVTRIVSLRRACVDEGEIDPIGARGLESIAAVGNPWDRSPSERTVWARGLDVKFLAEGDTAETIYWVGCAGAFDDHARSVVRAAVKLLRAGGVEVAVLGEREGCTGDIARRLGEEGLFEAAALRNIRMLRAHGVRRIITHCPHCMQTFANEYPRLGGKFEVVHHSQILSRLLSEGKLKPVRRLDETVTFHDACYLARYQDIVDAPREVVAAVDGVRTREMPRSRKNGLCCGGGGGLVLVDVKIGERIPNIRVAEAAETGANVVATGCPFCKLMLEPAADEREGAKVRVRDVAEILADACGV